MLPPMKRYALYTALFALSACDDGAADNPPPIVLADAAALDAARDQSVADAFSQDARSQDAAPDAQADAGVMQPPVEDLLRTHVETLAGEIGSRGLRRGAALRRTLDYLDTTLTAMGYTVERETYAVGEQEATNLYVDLTGTQRPGDIVVIGAHYDSVPSTPGADDNASGVAATLELARAFAGRPQPQTVRFVFFGNEEPPYFQTDAMGSLVHARGMAAANLQVTAMASLEMLGFFSDEPGSQEVPLGLAGLFPDTGNFVAFISDIPSSSLLDEAHAAFMGSSGFPAEKLAAPGNLPEAGFSDHWSFWQADFRAIMITDTAFFRNPHYHEPTDTVDTLDYARFGQLFPGLVGMIEALAD